MDFSSFAACFLNCLVPISRDLKQLKRLAITVASKAQACIAIPEYAAAPDALEFVHFHLFTYWPKYGRESDQDRLDRFERSHGFSIAEIPEN